MRESLTYNMIPIPHDEIVNIAPTNVITNISSNAYYGYQPRIYTRSKQISQTERSNEVSKENIQMDVQYDNVEENNMQIENSGLQHVNRKRRSEQMIDVTMEFKKRRQNGNSHFKLEINRESSLQKEECNLEDILRETHGVTMYHWLSNWD